MEPTKVVCPIVHLNGSSKESLIDGRMTAYDKLRDAVNAVCDMAPNGRDYYPVDGLMTKAQAQHERRVSTLLAIQVEIESELELLTKIA